MLVQVLASLRHVGLAVIVVGVRGLGRKELIVRVVQAGHDLVLRINSDISLIPSHGQTSQPVVSHLRLLPSGGDQLGAVQQLSLPCQVRVVRGTIWFSRSGRIGDWQEAAIDRGRTRPSG